MTKEDLLAWLGNIVMDPNAPHHAWPIYDQALRTAREILAAESTEVQRLRAALADAVEELHAWNYHNSMNLEDAEAAVTKYRELLAGRAK